MLFFPVLNAEDNPAENGPSWRLQDGLNFVQGQTNAATGLHASIDGVPVQNLTAYRTRNYSPFSITLPPSNDLEQLLFGYTGPRSIYPVVADGYYLMVAPLPRASTRLTLGENSGSFTLNITYTLNVVPGDR